MTIKLDLQLNNTQLVYEYGCRLSDDDSEKHVWEQIRKARALYNDIIAIMRGVYDEMQAFVMAHAGNDATRLVARLEQENAAFSAAKANNDEAGMKVAAESRRGLWKELSPLLKAVRKEYKEELASRFYSRIGGNSTCETYQCRCAAVRNGLGGSTATQVLNSALKAWSMSMAKGKPPMFTRGEEKQQDTLSLQFTERGGAGIKDIFTGKRKELFIEYPKDGFRKRSYTPFQFRLGPATDGLYAEGTVQVDREIPAGARVSMARLVCRKKGQKNQYSLQLQVTTKDPVRIEVGKRKPLVALHFGWSFDDSGRRLAGASDNGDALDARLYHLPADIEADLRLADTVQGHRDEARDQIIARLKSEWNCEHLEESHPVRGFWEKNKKLPAQHISANRLHHLEYLMRESGEKVPDFLEEWRKSDKMAWQKQVGLAKRARNRRKTLYRKWALDLARQYSAIALEMPDLKKAAEKVDQVTGEKTDFVKKARHGRTLAALYEFKSAIQWAACRAESAVFQVSGEPTVMTCAICESSENHASAEDEQELLCDSCGSRLNRKLNGAAVVWRMVNEKLEELVTEYWASTLEKQKDAAEKKVTRLQKMQEGRRKNRESL
jgi:hypothetical protein